jgi:S-adenosylmethionine:tRNA ribosyltransferase-isomerase
MRATDFDFDLPESLIALEPVAPRDACGLLVLDRKKDALEHRRFRELPGLLSEGDMLLMNNTRVFPARLTGTKKTGGKIDMLLVKEHGPGEWEVLSKGRYTGRLQISEGVGGEMHDGRLFTFDPGAETASETVWRFGQMPLPPYIKRRPSEADKKWYQTVYAEKEGSIAAPTAGLHFTGELIEELQRRGVLVRFLTLHVGTGTFKPITAVDIEDHRMEKEYFEVDEDLMREIREVKKAGKRVITVGTTTTRAIEAVFQGAYAKTGTGMRGNGDPEPDTLRSRPIRGSTDIFIFPGYTFGVSDALLTNFHLPRSTTLMLASAFCGREKLMAAYRHAVAMEYRFFSYGDAMLIL